MQGMRFLFLFQHRAFVNIKPTQHEPLQKFFPTHNNAPLLRDEVSAIVAPTDSIGSVVTCQMKLFVFSDAEARILMLTRDYLVRDI